MKWGTKYFQASSSQESYNTSGYQVSADLDDVEFYWEKSQLDLDAVSRPGNDTPFSTRPFDDLEMGESAENPLCSTKRKTKRILLQQQQHQSLRDQDDTLLCWEVVQLERE